ncbi:pentapeptide repeat-containing protein [Nocardioides oleivorans]|uniref:Pentapeptide repeat-containing protein n=1 Tax=Nocardioides oleivorans TaxID=273676 RepID=A0A4Q2S268_9ACTN|nr:pentapeptide repeat-containing protein [Nocardioides oleivorans]RYB94419.1 pentapeptide repeat-containing protein [Nocardioides oleivorans]
MSLPDLPVLSSDCSQCSGLCCVLLPFSRDDGFKVSKPGGTPCANLAADDSCGIHATLRRDGWVGCTRFECFGAGQHVTRVTFAGASWRDQTDLGEMAAVLSVVRGLHEMLLHLRTAADRAAGVVPDGLVEEIVALDHADPVTLLTTDLDELQARVGTVLRDASVAVRGSGPDLSYDDLAGRDLRTRDLGRATLRGAVLIQADLRDTSLDDTDLLGADLRDADVRGTDLSSTLFLTQPQVNGARGDARTVLPDGIDRPGHWT